MATPVTTVASGGLAVVEVAGFGMPVTETTRGIAVTKVTGKPGMGVTFVPATGGALSPPLEGLSGIAATHSASRKMLAAYAGPFYGLTTGKVSTLNDQSGAARNLTQATGVFQPTVVVSGPNNRDALYFPGGQWLDGPAISNFFTASAKYAVVSFIADTVTAADVAIYKNHSVWGDDGGIVAQCLSAGPKCGAFNWDGTGKEAPVGSAAISTGVPYVVEYRHESGNLYQRINGGSWSAATACGNSTAMTGIFRLGRGWTTSGIYFIGKIFELATFTSLPSDTQKNNLVANMMSYVGAT